MRRQIYKKLLQWKDAKDRKPLVLEGARQVGKTYILKLFGEQEWMENIPLYAVSAFIKGLK